MPVEELARKHPAIAATARHIHHHEHTGLRGNAAQPLQLVYASAEVIATPTVFLSNVGNIGFVIGQSKGRGILDKLTASEHGGAVERQQAFRHVETGYGPAEPPAGHGV